MKKMLSGFLLIGLLSVCAAAVAAQRTETPRPTPIPAVNQPTSPNPMNRPMPDIFSDEGRDYEKPDRPVRPIAEMRRELKEKLKLSDADKENYKKLAGDKKANVSRMISSFSCSTSMVVDLSDPRCSDNPDFIMASYFSFRFKYYGEGPWTDISLIEDDIATGNKWQTLGILADLGEEADLGKLNEKSEEVRTLWDFHEPETMEEKARQRVELEKGFTEGKLFLSSKMKYHLGHTYLVRTISYRMDGFYGVISGFSWHNTDSLFAFKIVGIEDDRTVTLVWKKIFQKIAPVLEDKKEKKDKKEQNGK